MHYVWFFLAILAFIGWVIVGVITIIIENIGWVILVAIIILGVTFLYQYEKAGREIEEKKVKEIQDKIDAIDKELRK